MQYVLMIYQGSSPLPGSDAWDALSEQEQKQIYADYAALQALEGFGSGVPLGLPEKAKTVRVEDGRTVTLDRPFVGGDGVVGGCAIFEADDIDDAIDVASRIPAARHGGAIEVRPVETYW